MKIFAINEETKKVKSFTTYLEMEDFIRKVARELAENSEKKKKMRDPKRARAAIEAVFRSEVKEHKVTVDGWTYIDTLSRLAHPSTRI